MDSAVYRVASVHTSVSKEAMRSVMDAYGNIVRVLFWRTDANTGRHHYFVEYDRPESVGRACRSQAQDVVVHALAAARPLCDVYKALVQGDDSANAGFFHPGFNQGMAREKERERELTRKNSTAQSPRTGPYDRPGPSNSRSNGYANGSSTSTLPRRPSFVKPSSSLGSSREHSATDLPPISPPTPKQPAFDTLMSSISSGPPPKTTPLPLDTSIPITDMLPPLQQTISLSYNSIPITFDLTKLDSDPATIVALLQQTRAERGLWAVVAGWYRRHGHAMSALAVLHALLDGVAQHSLPDRELRPIFFMLANCHRDLAHTTDKAKAQEHREHMRRWLQRALGTQTEERAGEPSFAVPYDSFKSGTLNGAADSNWSIKAEYGSYKQGSSSGDKVSGPDMMGPGYSQQQRDRDRELKIEKEEHERDVKRLREAESEVDSLRLKLRETERRRDLEVRRAEEEEERADRERRLRLDEREDAERLFSAISGIANKAANGGDLAVLATGVVKLVR
ncbi:hypothetical protein PENSPDRAFT_657535 [Peniophora sp. CONT]|nr:hypothetical protein PENSPDRAFT_657535 [Peniophora sp. CONT]